MKEPIKLTIYGSKTSLYEHVRYSLINQSKELGLEVQFTEVDNWKQIVVEELDSIPAIKIAEKKSMSIAKGEHVNAFVQRVLHEILKLNNYGNGKKVFIPVDFSETSANAALFAFDLAADINAVICLFHVHQTVTSILDIDIEFQNSKLKKLEDFATTLKERWESTSSKSMIVMTEIAIGATVQEIVSRASLLEDVWIVIGSSGADNVIKKAFGSITTNVVKQALIPVLIVPPKARYKGFKKIAFAYAAMDQSTSPFIDKLVEFAQHFDAELNFVHVMNQGVEIVQLDWVEHLKTKYPACKLHSSFTNNDDIIKGLNDFAESCKLDLLCLSTQKRGFLEDLFHRSVSRSMVIHSTIPILTLPNQ